MSAKKRGLCLLFIPLFILLIFIFIFDKYLDYRLEKGYNNLITTYQGEFVKDSGVFLQEKGMADDDIMMFGSSELAVPIPQNPREMFPNQFMPYNANIIGKAHCQDLIHAINIGGLNESIKDKKVVYILSMQWFISEDKKGDINFDGFASNFSDIKYYNYMKNPNISESEKTEVSNRINYLLKSYPQKNKDYLYSTLNNSDNIFKKGINLLMEPYYYGRNKILSIKDKYESLVVLQNIEGNPLEKKNLNWSDELEKAEKMGKDSTTNNDLYIENEYYDSYLKDSYDEFKDSYKNIDLNNSKEWHDFEIFLETCKQTGVSPYIVLMPVHGEYYDYLGMDKAKRDEFYNKAEKMANSYNFSTLNLKDKEYEPYFMYDTIHLGWKGWLNINEKIVEHFNNSKK